MKAAKRLISVTGMRDILQRRIPMMSLDSTVGGPVVWLTACIHGDEVGGTAIVHDVFAKVRAIGLQRGVVHALPLINSMGFENVSRFINADREDLNRCFPGNPHGTMGEQIAYRLFETITQSRPDLVIDIHNDWVRSIPYTVVEPAAEYASPEIQQRVLRMARTTGLFLVEDSDRLHAVHNTLAGALSSAGIPAFTLEAGGAFAIVEQSVATGKDAVLSVLQSLDMINYSASGNQNDDSTAPLKYTNQPLCMSSGLIRFEVSPAEAIKSRQTLARVYGAFGSCEETLRAARPGYVLGLEDHARVLPGRQVIAIAEMP